MVSHDQNSSARSALGEKIQIKINKKHNHLSPRREYESSPGRNKLYGHVHVSCNRIGPIRGWLRAGADDDDRRDERRRCRKACDVITKYVGHFVFPRKVPKNPETAINIHRSAILLARTRGKIY